MFLCRAAFGHVVSAYRHTMIQGVFAVVKWVFSGVRIFLPVNPATRPVTLRGPGVPMNTSSDAGREGNGGTQRRKDAMKRGFPPTRE